MESLAKQPRHLRTLYCRPAAVPGHARNDRIAMVLNNESTAPKGGRPT